MNNKKNIIKILFLGLDNSGKTSIVKSLQGIKNLPNFCKIKPTKGKDIRDFQAFDTEFTIWDLGGQISFREGYLKELDKIIVGCNKLIFVIDIQDIDRYEIAIDFFQKVIDLIKDNPNAKEMEISIFLHKSDPDLFKTQPGITEETIINLKDRIKSIIDKTDFFYQIFKTSIYAFFEKIVID